MKVKELIKFLEKENQESDVKFKVDKNLIADIDYGWMLAEDVKVEGEKTFYWHNDEYKEDPYDDICDYLGKDDLLDTEYEEEIRKLEKIEGVFISVEP